MHDKILDDRPLDETHPLWPASHYGAHKAALEAFVHSYGFGHGFPICALRPTGIYGLAHAAQTSKWFDLVAAVARGDVECRRGGKEVHAADVARAAALLLGAEPVAGEAYNCYDRYISEFEVATLARELAGSRSAIQGEAPTPRHQIVTTKLQALGMRFGGLALLKQTIAEMIEAATFFLKPCDRAPSGAKRDRAGPAVVEPASVALSAGRGRWDEAGPDVFGGRLACLGGLTIIVEPGLEGRVQLGEGGVDLGASGDPAFSSSTPFSASRVVSPVHSFVAEPRLEGGEVPDASVGGAGFRQLLKGVARLLVLPRLEEAGPLVHGGVGHLRGVGLGRAPGW